MSRANGRKAGLHPEQTYIIGPAQELRVIKRLIAGKAKPVPEDDRKPVGSVLKFDFTVLLHNELVRQGRVNRLTPRFLLDGFHAMGYDVRSYQTASRYTKKVADLFHAWFSGKGDRNPVPLHTNHRNGGPAPVKLVEVNQMGIEERTLWLTSQDAATLAYHLLRARALDESREVRVRVRVRNPVREL